MLTRGTYFDRYMKLLPREFWPAIKHKIASRDALESGESLQIPTIIWLAYITPPDPSVKNKFLGKFKKIWQLKTKALQTLSDPRVFLKTRGPLHKSSDIVTLILLELLFGLNRKKILLEEKEYREWLEVANRFGLWKLRYLLEDAIFKTFDQENFLLFESVVNKQMSMDKYLVLAVRSILEDALMKAGLKKFRIENRAKNIYGVYRKVALKRKSINDIYDIHGFRILVTTPEECYGAINVLHRLWPRFPERFKDYISNPKENGYRSIHTVLSCLEKKPIEFQVRTYEMDSVAASGPANHADYKDKKCKVTLSELF